MASMFCHSLLLTTVITQALSLKIPYYIPKARPKLNTLLRTCGTAEPDPILRDTHYYLSENEDQPNDLWSSANVSARFSHANSKRDLPPPMYTIDTWFHVVADTNNSQPGGFGYVTDTMLQKQLAYLTDKYGKVGIAFNLVGTTRTTNDTWARNGDDLAMKTLLRQGTYSTLNVYYQTLLQTKSATGTTGSILLGYCSLPSPGITPTTSRSVYVLDGCNILSGTLPGSYEDSYNLGGTSAHEIGHWNGLLHTFQDTTCAVDNFGDYVADTPQESRYTEGCEINKDTCPDSGIPEGTYTGQAGTTNPYGPQGYSGPDPIHNFMDYSQDSCYEGFTAGQAARMVNLWALLRMGN